MGGDRKAPHIKEGLNAMITLKDIAAECRVSISTVSRALNGNELIRPELAASIRETAVRMGYQPNEAARSLKLNRSWMIGILHDEAVDHPFFSGMLEALRISAEKRGCDTVLLSRRQRNNSSDSSDLALSRRVDGIIVAYADVADDGLDRLMKNQIPVVSVDDCNRPCPIIASDYENGTRLLTEEAVRRGHRRVVFVHGEPGSSTSRRIAGYRAALAAHGLPEELIPSTFNSAERCARLVLSRLRRPDPPSCFLLPDDTSALYTLNVLRHEGLSVPRDVAVAGFDGQRWARTLFPALSTFRQNLEQIGEAALETLLRSRESGFTRERSEIIIPGALIPGETL